MLANFQVIKITGGQELDLKFENKKKDLAK